ncbi:MAG: hypothetical protein GXP48_00485 [Acidobacteria bacterium]|nr:hypothetical protein [Acidobacteriota bacterium]
MQSRSCTEVGPQANGRESKHLREVPGSITAHHSRFGLSRLAERSIPGLWWLPVGMAGAVSAGVAAVLSFPLHLPVLVPHLSLAWTLVRVLIEL